MSVKEMNSSKTDFLAAQQDVREKEYKYLRQLRQSFRQEANILFHDHSSLFTFIWNQASNPDNDYEFFVSRLEYDINGVSTNSIGPGHELYPALKDINEFLELFDDDDLRKLFGDHAKVTVTRHQVSVAFHDVELI